MSWMFLALLVFPVVRALCHKDRVIVPSGTHGARCLLLANASNNHQANATDNLGIVLVLRPKIEETTKKLYPILKTVALRGQIRLPNQQPN